MKEIVTKKKCGGLQNNEIFIVASLVAARKVDSFKCKLVFMELATLAESGSLSYVHVFNKRHMLHSLWPKVKIYHTSQNPIYILIKT